MATTLPLFTDAPEPGAIEIRREGDRLFYACPHCGGEMSSQDVDEESLAELRADPACCFCRAAFAGLPFQVWRRLPLEVRRTHRPPAGWTRPAVKVCEGTGGAQ
jgi:hypothetical protein